MWQITRFVQSVDHIYHWRYLARGRLDIPGVGNDPWHRSHLLSPKKEGLSILAQLGVYLLYSSSRMGILSRKLIERRLEHVAAYERFAR